MDQKAHNLFALAVAALPLLGANLAEHHGVDDLEMRGLAVSDRCTFLPSKSRSVESEMIFDVARALDIVGIGGVALKFGNSAAKACPLHWSGH